jgi:hypothetical protein
MQCHEIFALNPLPSPYAPKISIHPRISAKLGLVKKYKVKKDKRRRLKNESKCWYVRILRRAVSVAFSRTGAANWGYIST